MSNDVLKENIASIFIEEQAKLHLQGSEDSAYQLLSS
jgi:hypothetical protein